MNPKCDTHIISFLVGDKKEESEASKKINGLIEKRYNPLHTDTVGDRLVVLMVKCEQDEPTIAQPSPLGGNLG